MAIGKDTNPFVEAANWISRGLSHMDTRRHQRTLEANTLHAAIIQAHSQELQRGHERTLQRNVFKHQAGLVKMAGEHATNTPGGRMDIEMSPEGGFKVGASTPEPSKPAATRTPKPKPEPVPAPSPEPKKRTPKPKPAA